MGHQLKFYQNILENTPPIFPALHLKQVHFQHRKSLYFSVVLLPLNYLYHWQLILPLLLILLQVQSLFLPVRHRHQALYLPVLSEVCWQVSWHLAPVNNIIPQNSTDVLQAELYHRHNKIHSQSTESV